MELGERTGSGTTVRYVGVADLDVAGATGGGIGDADPAAAWGASGLDGRSARHSTVRTG